MATLPMAGDVGRSGGPALGIKLSSRIATAWRRGKTKANRLLSNTPPEVFYTPESSPPPPPSFPYDIVEMVIAHLTRHRDTLEACSLTCRSWYIAAAPHLHHTLTLMGNRHEDERNRLEPLSKLHELGLMPLVREIRVKQRIGLDPWFVPPTFDHSDLYYFSAFTNVHTLNIEGMKIHRFMPDIKHYFEQFSPTLRSITLSDLNCAPRQLSHFLSLFPNLDDIEIRNTHAYTTNTTVPDTVLSSTPRLRGRLALYNSRWAETWTHLMTLSNGLRFRHVDLLNVGSCGPVLLDACAETLETLRVGARDDSVRNLDLSRLKVLRSLQVKAWPVNHNRGGHRPTIVKGVFSTIKSPVFSEVVIVITSYAVYLPTGDTLFKTLREMNEVRPFKLVFLLEASDFHQEQVQRELVEALDVINANNSLNFLTSKPTIRIARPRNYLWDFPDIN